MPLKLIKRHNSPNFYIRGTVRGTAVDETTGTSDRQRAEALRIKREGELLDRSIYGERATATFSQAALGYLESGGSNRYLQQLVARWGKTPCQQIDQHAIDQAANELYPKGTGDTRNRHVYTPAISVLHWASTRGLCSWRRFRRPKMAPGRIRFITPEEADRFLSCGSATLRPLAVFLLYTGCRLNEALSLEWRNVTLASMSCSVPRTKTNTPRAIRLHRRAADALKSLPHREGPVFDYPHRWAVYVDWRRACKAAGLQDFTPHDCRHTFATWLRRYGGLDTLGLLATGAWKDAKSVARYAHVAADEAQAAIDKLPGEISAKSGKLKRK